MTRIVFAAALLAVMAGAAAADDRRQLPPLMLAGPNSAKASAELPAEGRWLLVYVRDECRACGELLAQINRKERPGADRLVVVVHTPSTDTLAALSAKYPNLQSARWYADTDGSARTALRLRGAPFVLGIRDTSVSWTLAGVLPNDAELESVLFTWLQEQK